MILVALFALHPIWLPAFYAYLDVSQSPKQADVIVVLGGSRGWRETYAAELYRQGYAPTVLVSGSLKTISYSLGFLKRGGVLTTDILVNDQATSTYDEAQQVLALLLERSAASALVVTDRFHTRRAAATYLHVVQGHSINVSFVSPNDGVDVANWWNSRLRDRVVSEYIKIIYYGINYGVWSNTLRGPLY